MGRILALGLVRIVAIGIAALIALVFFLFRDFSQGGHYSKFSVLNSSKSSVCQAGEISNLLNQENIENDQMFFVSCAGFF